MLTVYGISNCSTVKKACVWLDKHQIAYEFHDYKKLGVPASALKEWIEQLGWEVLVNRKGMTWRKQTPEQQAKVVDALSAHELMLAFPSLIKRPLVMRDDGVVAALGFNEAEWVSVFAH